MTINKLGPIDPVNNYTKAAKVQKTAPKAAGDAIQVSKEAVGRAELIKTAEIVKKAPDVRMDKINEVKAKLQNPDYINETVINSVADKIIENFGL